MDTPGHTVRMTDDPNIEWGATRAQPLGAPAYRPQSSNPPPYFPPTPARKSQTGLIVGLSIAIVVLLGAGVVGALVLSGHSPVQIHGLTPTMTVNGTLIVAPPCGGLGYSDIRGGTEVTITDQAGTVLAVGRLIGEDCRFEFMVPGVPTGKKLYGVTISHRGTLHYTEDEMRAGLSLSLG
jgi:hypothetical protein